MRYGYDARDRLTSFDNGRGQTTDYVLDPSGNITTETKGGTTRTFTYVGDRLATMTKGAQATKYHYDAEGNLDCATDGSGSSADCNGTDYNGNPSARVTAEYSYDYLNRLTAYRSANAGAPDDSATYVHDALDRVVRQSESHGGTSAVRTTDYSYLGLSKLATGETHKNNSGATTTTKSYTYDSYGNRVAMTNTPQGQATQSYTFGYDVHGSTSLLIGGTGQAAQSYGYGPYGDTDAALTSDGNSDDPLNAFRYTGKRFDSGSGTLDMGARHFSSDTGRFLQQDFFNGAMADLGLGLNPLTQNRYGLAGGNPVSYLELDGHRVVADGGGTAAKAPNFQMADKRASSGGSGGGGTSTPAASPGDFQRAQARSMTQAGPGGGNLPKCGPRLSVVVRCDRGGGDTLDKVAVGFNVIDTLHEVARRATQHPDFSKARVRNARGQRWLRGASGWGRSGAAGKTGWGLTAVSTAAEIAAHWDKGPEEAIGRGLLKGGGGWAGTKLGGGLGCLAGPGGCVVGVLLGSLGGTWAGEKAGNFFFDDRPVDLPDATYEYHGSGTETLFCGSATFYHAAHYCPGQ